MNYQEDKDFVVFTQRLAGYLMFHGCRLIKLKRNKKDPKKYVYFFPDNKRIKELIDHYYKTFKN